MRQKSLSKRTPAERTVRDIRRKTRKQYSAEKIRIAVSGLRGEESIGALCRHQGIAEGLVLQLVAEHSLENRLLKAHDLITSPAFVVTKAAVEFKDKTTTPNQLCQEA